MPALTRGLLAVLLLVPGVGCRQPTPAPFVPGGDAERGRLAIQHYGCGTCHAIRGVTGARGQVGPPLNLVGRRLYVAGVERDNPEGLVRWLMNPPAVDFRTAMPYLGVTLADARDIAEYLYRLSPPQRW